MKPSVGASSLTFPGSFILLSEALTDRFTLRRSLGDTPTSLLYLAEDESSHGAVTLSVLRPEVLAGMDQDRLREGFEAARSLDHPGIEAVLDMGQAGDAWYSTSMYSLGWSIRDKLAAHGTAPVAQSFAILAEILDALAHAHARDIIHGLLTPSLVILTERGVVVRGFGPGMSLWHARSENTLPPGLVTQYTAPELRASQAAPGAPADLYSFGAVAQELLLGQPPGAEPWGVDGLAQAFRARVGAGRESSGPALDEGALQLASLVADCLEADPAARPDGAAVVRERLLSAVTTLGVELPAEAGEHPQDPGQIGQYRILERLGEGGMGVVYRAEKVGDLTRSVALKVVRMGMDTREVVGRFEREWEALGLLSHEHVARIYDASVSEGGRPYFVMELVDGIPVTDYADAHRLTLPERLRLFESVCSGVQHAHQKGVVHRDLKPSNVLVAGEASEATPKIIDFGLAKVMGDPLRSSGDTTRLGQVMGTPEYMSPEQAAGRTADVDTRTDVYALGALLHELLTGFVPAPAAAPDGDPLPPSQIVARHPELALIAERRGTDPGLLPRQLARDLDFVALKALDRERERRYQTVNALIDDVRRHLADEPIAARPPTPWYRMQKFVRRHRAGVVAGAALSVALIGGLAATTVLWLRAMEAEETARVEAETADQVVEFMTGLFEQTDPFLEGDPTLVEVLDRGAERIRSELDDQPLVRARVQGSIARAYTALRLTDKMEAAYRDQVAILGEHLGESHPEHLQALAGLGAVLAEGEGIEESAEIYRRILAALRASEHPDSALLGRALRNFGWIETSLSHWESADSLSAQAVAVMEAHLGPDHIELARTLLGLSQTLFRSDRAAEAVPHIRRALAIVEAAEHPRKVEYLTETLRFGMKVFSILDDYEEAERWGYQALERLEEEVGGDHPDIALIRQQFGSVLMGQGRDQEAVEMLERAVSIIETSAPNHPFNGGILPVLGLAYMRVGRYAEAREVIERAFPFLEDPIGPVDMNVALAFHQMGVLETMAGNFARAEELLRRALEVWEKVDLPSRLGTAVVYGNLGEMYESMNRLDEAEEAYRTAVEIAEQGVPAEHPLLIRVRQEHARILRVMGREEEARAVEEKIPDPGG